MPEIARISNADIVGAVRAFSAMSLAQRARLADEVHEHQPNLLASVLVLKNFGATLAQIDTALRALLVTWLAMKASGHVWPLITKELQGLCLGRLTAAMREHDKIAEMTTFGPIERHVAEHKEKHLLAYLYLHLQESDALGIRSEPEKYLVLATINLGECVATASSV